MKRLQELDFFERLFENPQNELVDKAIEQGRIAVGYNCYEVPEPLISAGKLFPLWLTAPGLSDTAQANYYLSSVTCTYCRAVLEYGIDGRYDFLGACVFAPTCDHIRRSCQHFDLLNLNDNNDKYFTYMIDAPGKKSEVTVPWFAQDMRKAAAKFNEVYDANITDETVSQAIKEFNEFNALIKSIGDFRKEKNPRITGAEWAKIYGACKIAPKDMLIEPLKRIKAEIEARKPDNDNKPRVLLIGSTIDNPEFTELFEAQGATIVGDRYCFGSLPGMDPIKEDGDPFMNLSEYYLSTCKCPRMMEKGRERQEYTKQLIKEYDVDGVIFEEMTFCDLWNYEKIMFTREMKSINFPYVTISKEYTLTGEGQLRTRVQAFLESMKSKKEQETLKNSK